MNKSRIWKHFAIIVAFSLFWAFTANPWKLPEMETEIPVITDTWNWVQQSQISLGLDLQGGTQLDYEIDLTDARARNEDDDDDNDVDIAQLLQGVKDVIERRVNSLGVAEPNIYLSSAGEEEHIVVELPGVEDIAEARERVGKVVQLEFKTQKEETDEEEAAQIVKDATSFLAEMLASGEPVEDLEAYIEDIAKPGKVQYLKQEDLYLDNFPKEFHGNLESLEPGEFSDTVLRANEGPPQGDYQPEGFNIIRLIDKKKKLRKAPVNAEEFVGLGVEFKGNDYEDYAQESIVPEDIQLDVVSLSTDEVSGVIESDHGFYIAKMTEVIPADEEGEGQINTSHILFKTEELEPLNQEVPIKEIPEDATEEERKRLEEENRQAEEDNAAIRKKNKEAERENDRKKNNNIKVKTKAEQVLAELKEDPSRFTELATQHSEDSSSSNGGNLGYADPNMYVPEYRDAALELEEGEFTQELVKSQFGYHIVKLEDFKPADEERYSYSTIRVCYQGAVDCPEDAVSKEEAEEQATEIVRRAREEFAYSIERVWFNALPDPWAKTELDGRYFKRASVAYNQTNFIPYVAIEFDDKGAELFAQLTEENINKRLGIFVGGEFISAPNINEKITGGQAQITLGISNPQIALKEANDLTTSLNAGSIPAPLKKPNELNIGASLGAKALDMSLKAGAIGLILVAAFMILYYRMMGLLAGFSLLVYGLFLTFVIQSEITPVLSLTITFVMWIAFSMKLFRSKIDGLAKALFLIGSVLGVMFVFQVLVNPIVLTLAGVSGLILSIGMAVDANILIFERIKEEFGQGKSFLAAVNDGFERAWSSILDSNVSSLITCAILFFFGTSIIKGFAINLATGIVISMFTAITVTKTFMLLFEGTKLERVKWLWKKKE